MESLARDVERICKDAEKSYGQLEEALALRERELFVLERRTCAVRLTISRVRWGPSGAAPATVPIAGSKSDSHELVRNTQVQQQRNKEQGCDARAPLLPLNVVAEARSVTLSNQVRNESQQARFTTITADSSKENTDASGISFPVTVEHNQVASAPVRLFRWADRGYQFLVRRAGDPETTPKQVEQASQANKMTTAPERVAFRKSAQASIPDWNGILAHAPPIPAEKGPAIAQTASDTSISNRSADAPSKSKTGTAVRPSIQSAVPALQQAENVRPKDANDGSGRAMLVPASSSSSSGSGLSRAAKRTVRFADPEVQMPSNHRNQQAMVATRQHIVTAPAFRQRP
ncbi:hypothetical protein F1559_001661 [Cyanidiococcus yangmingshanensis]|uniref:Uncharacterized protein n=1 Tax=Cyanidiococcus yangmingshanensis TaxID=2690220 RepID=A0A7J7IKC1_9RHOD|nr:hypothetical protein F1559_001661 [Cyanidiococcus yangmingshanensis]